MIEPSSQYCTISNVHVYFLVSITYLNFHPSNGFTQLEHNEDQTWVNRLSAAGTGFLSVENTGNPVYYHSQHNMLFFFITKDIVMFNTFSATVRCIFCKRCGGTQL